MKMNFVHSIFFIFILVAFVAGLIFYIRPKTPYYEHMYEMMNNMDDTEDAENMDTENMDTEYVDAVDGENVDTIANNQTNEIEYTIAPTERIVQNTPTGMFDSIIIRPTDSGLDNKQNYIQTLGVSQNFANPIQNLNVVYNTQPVNTYVVPTKTTVIEEEEEGKEEEGEEMNQNTKNSQEKYQIDEDRSQVQTDMNMNAYSKRSVFGGAPLPYGDQPAIGPTPYQTIGPNKPPNGMDPSEMEMDKGSPSNPVKVKNAGYENSPYNQNMHYAFDPTSQYVGIYTEIDALRDSTANSMDDEMGASYSDNPMDANWGGVEWTRKSIESGKYDDDLVIPYNQANGFTESTRSKKIPVNRFA